MKALMVHDSAYGNTKQVAEAVAASLGRLRAQAVSVTDSKPMAFYVSGSEGPLRSGELEKAATWAEDLLTRAGR